MIFTLVVLILTIIASAVYTLIYRSSINKRLEQIRDGETLASRPMMSPLKFVCIFLLALFIIYIIVINIAFLMLKTQKKPVQELDTYSPPISVHIYTHDDPSITALLDPDEDIPGYTRSTENFSGFRVVTYTAETGMRDFPDMLIHCSYAGELKDGFHPYVCADYGYNTGTTAINGRFGLIDLSEEEGGIWYTVNVSGIDADIDISAYLMPEIAQGIDLPAEDIIEYFSGSCHLDYNGIENQIKFY